MEFKVLPVLAHSGRLAFRCSLFTLYVKKRAAVKEGRMDQMNDKKKMATKLAETKGCCQAPSFHAIGSPSHPSTLCELSTNKGPTISIAESAVRVHSIFHDLRMGAKTFICECIVLR